MQTVIAPVELRHRALVSTTTFERVSKRISKDHGFTPEIAEQILDAALGFLMACKDAKMSLAPSELVDVGWHTFLLYTPEYMKFCHEHIGHFVHHVPNDDPTKPSQAGGSLSTVEYMRSHSIPFDEVLWGVKVYHSYDEVPPPLCDTRRHAEGKCDTRCCVLVPDDDTPLMRLCGVENGRGPGCSHVAMDSAGCKGGSVDCDQGTGGGGSGYDGCRGVPK